MCQLTLLDVDSKTKLGKATIRNLMELNQQAITKYSPQTNEDGFGYMTFAKAPEIIKSGLSAVEWWHKNYKQYQKSVKNPNGIYHVRAASNNMTQLFEDDAHPFHHGHIILAHNGTMTEDTKLKNDEKLQKLFETYNIQEPMIDSEKFCKLLANICGDDKLTKEHIVKTMEYFHGPFAMLIYDTKQPKKVFVIRGKDRPLHMAEIYDGKKRGERIGLVLNTHLYELMFWSKQVKSIAKEFHNLNLHIGITLLSEESIFEYKVGTYDIGKAVEEIKQTTQVYTNTTTHHNVAANRRTYSGINNELNDNAQQFHDIYAISVDLGLTLSELMILAEYSLGNALHCCTLDQLVYFKEILERFLDFDYKGRKKVWKEFLKANKLHVIAGYKQTDISFPFMLDGKKFLTSKIRKYKVTDNVIL